MPIYMKFEGVDGSIAATDDAGAQFYSRENAGDSDFGHADLLYGDDSEPLSEDPGIAWVSGRGGTRGLIPTDGELVFELATGGGPQGELSIAVDDSRLGTSILEFSVENHPNNPSHPGDNGGPEEGITFVFGKLAIDAAWPGSSISHWEGVAFPPSNDSPESVHATYDLASSTFLLFEEYSQQAGHECLAFFVGGMPEGPTDFAGFLGVSVGAGDYMMDFTAKYVSPIVINDTAGPTLASADGGALPGDGHKGWIDIAQYNLGANSGGSGDGSTGADWLLL
jgi:hypothetical protein